MTRAHGGAAGVLVVRSTLMLLAPFVELELVAGELVRLGDRGDPSEIPEKVID